MAEVAQDGSAGAEETRREAARLYAAARELQERRDYSAAIEHYERSLHVYYDERVKADYFELLATIGPL
jgi:predicted ATPase